MTAANYDITIEQGTTWTLQMSLYTDSDNTVPWDLSGYAADMDIRSYKESDDTLATFSTTDGSIVISGSDSNVLTVTASASSTADYSFYAGVYDLEVSKDGVVTRIIQGKVKVSMEVTR